MADISEFERRLSAALERISAAIDRTGGGDAGALAAALEAERTANAQLEARVAAIKEKQETQVAALEAEVKALRRDIADGDALAEQLRQVNAALRRSNAALREANAQGLADSSLVNAALEAENAALKAAVDGNRAEIDDVLSMLEPLLEEN